MRVVVVGGGFGGVKTALELSNKPNVQVTLVSKGSNFEYHGALYRTATGHSPLEVTIPLREIFKHSHNVSIVLDEATKLDAKNDRVESSTGNSYKYDALVLAMGNQINYFGIAGMDKNSATIVTVPDTIDLRHKIVKLVKGNVLHPHIVVVGAGATGVELSGDLQAFADVVARQYGRAQKRFRISIVEGSDRVLPALKPKLSEKALIRLSKLGITVRLNTRVNSCEPGKLCLESGEIDADLIVWTAGSRAVDFYDKNAKHFTRDRGRVKVDNYLRAVGHKNIYVIGDNAATKFTGMAQTALHDAKYVSRILMKMQKGVPPVVYRARKPIYVVPIGERWAVLQTPKQIVTGYKAWLVRRRADLWIFKNFKPYKEAILQWRKGNKRAIF